MSMDTPDNYPLGHLYTWDGNYSLHEDVFTEDICDDVFEKTGLSRGSLGDWWVFEKNPNPIFSWEQLITLAIQIFKTKATKLFMEYLYVEKDYTPVFQEVSETLPQKSISGAKRVNADSESFNDYAHTHMDALESLLHFANGGKIESKEVKLSQNHFRLSGKDESCWVEGSWDHWCMFACNILASENTKIVCPELYAPGLKNDNY